ncbi:MAG: tetratricopeptide repeat protein, partial [Verrucomicrobiales bacterium]|nr:tetratricopeptide repeat protein [Verrucomicrobiales bacterium]
AFQLTFWEHATAMTGEMVSLLVFASCVYCFLRFRVMQEDRYLALLSFLFGAGISNDWGLIAFCPLFIVAILWAKGLTFFEAKFLIRTTLAGLAGLLFYFLQPIVLKATGQADGSILELARTGFAYQRQLLLNFPRWAVGFAGVASVLPVVFMGIRWPTTFSDMSAAGAALTNAMFRLIHVAFLAVCGWVMFDPPFSPRALGFGSPFLHFYFLTALSLGYASGYMILVFGEEPERKIKRTSEGMAALGRLVSVLAAVSVLAGGAGLAWYNLPAIRGQNGDLVREMALTLVPPAGSPAVVVSDEGVLLLLSQGVTREAGVQPPPIPLHTQLIRHHVYQRHHEAAYGKRWPALVLEQLSEPLGEDAVLQQVSRLGLTHRLFYLHPSFGYYFELYHQVPENGVHAFFAQATNSYVRFEMSPAAFEATHAMWQGVRQRWVDDPVLERLRAHRTLDAGRVATHYSRSLNAWGVELQRRGQLEEAAGFFEAALRLSPENLAATINQRFNAGLRTGRSEPVVLDDQLNDRLGQFRDIPSFLLVCGPVDEPGFCFNLGRTFVQGGLYRQAAQQFARAGQLNPKVTDHRFWLASATLSAGLYDLASQQIAGIRSEVKDLTPAQECDLQGMESWALFRRGDFAAAERGLLEVGRRFPDRIEPVQVLNDIYVQANRTNQALATIEQLVRRLPNDPRPLITKSAIQMQLGNVTEAIDTLSIVLTNQPGYFPALVNRALALTQAKRFDEAERDYLKLLDIAPGVHQVFFHLGEIDVQRGKPDSARRHYQNFLERVPPGSAEARTAQQRLDAIAAGRVRGE